MMNYHFNSFLTSVLKSKLLLLVAGMNLFSCLSYSQSPGKGETVEFINKVLGERIQVELKTGTILVSFRDENGNLLREDKAPSPDLDLTITYEPEDKLLCIPCMKDQPECVTRTLVVQKIKRGYGRLSIPVASEKDFYSLQKAFDHLIRILSENKYKDAITLD
ncbi:MAG: hypothetical protein IPN36_13635 [Bacteroidetes bacterium]|nr:hypothetical protein [Bacteroidota bacterium]